MDVDKIAERVSRKASGRTLDVPEIKPFGITVVWVYEVGGTVPLGKIVQAEKELQRLIFTDIRKIIRLMPDVFDGDIIERSPDITVFPRRNNKTAIFLEAWVKLRTTESYAHSPVSVITNNEIWEKITGI